MSEHRTPGWIYVLASQSHPGIVKIGRTTRPTPSRMIEVHRSEYAAFGPWIEVWSIAVSDCVHVETASHRMLANRRVKLDRLGCKELFRIDDGEACRVVEAAAGSLVIPRRQLPTISDNYRRRRGLRWSRRKRRLRARGVMLVLAAPVALWLIATLLH